MAEARARLDAALFRLSAAEMGLANARHDAARRDAAAALSGLSGLFGALGGMIMAAIKLVLLVLLYRSFFGF
jgi:sugar phosphate permease